MGVDAKGRNCWAVMVRKSNAERRSRDIAVLRTDKGDGFQEDNANVRFKPMEGWYD